MTNISHLEGIYMRSGRTQIDMNLYRYECLKLFTWNPDEMFGGSIRDETICFFNKYMADLKAVQAWNFWTWSEICCETGTNSDRFEQEMAY